MNKPFEVSSYTELGYMLAPLRRAQKAPDVKGYDFSEDIDWEMVSVASEKWAVPFVDLRRLKEEAEDAVIQDRAVEFTNRCEILRIREDMTPLNEVEGQVSTILFWNVALSQWKICFLIERQDATRAMLLS
jgi:endoribonuclease Dicer